LGLHRATDVIGGYHALAAAGVLNPPQPDALHADLAMSGRRWI
jgi:hypothetical protein